MFQAPIPTTQFLGQNNQSIINN